jgi:hypothetical protein
MTIEAGLQCCVRLVPDCQCLTQNLPPSEPQLCTGKGNRIFFSHTKMFCKRISTQASPTVKFPTCKLQIASEANHNTQTRLSTENDRRLMLDTEPTSITTIVTHRKRKSYFLLTYKDVLQDDFDSGIPNTQISHLQTANNKRS